MEQEIVAGRYRLDERVGLGGMAEVWAAEDIELGRRVALKLLSQHADPARFEREARAVAALAHPNICQLYDYGNEGGRPFMVLEYLGGGTLEERLVAGEPYGDDETDRIASEIADALAHAHARDLVHRDLKPANVLFDDEGRAKIADFGIARIGDVATLTETGTMLGTAAYISPEQAQGLPATAASDVYSFGVILFRMLTGRLPFESESAIDLARMHVEEQPPPVLELRPDAPRALAVVADAALVKDPEARPPDGAALAAALEGPAATLSGARTVIAPGAVTAATAVIPGGGAPPPTARGGRQLLPLAIAALILLAGAGAAVAIFATRGSGSQEQQQPAAKPAPKKPQSTATTAPASSSSQATTTTAPTTTRATTAPSATPPPPTTRSAPTTTAVTEPPPPPPTTVPPTTTVATTTPPPPPPSP